MKVGIIGSGQMAQALCRGFLSAAVLKPSDILTSDVNRSNLREMREYGVQTTVNNLDVVQANSIVYLAVKPKNVSAVLREISSNINIDKLLVSLAAGITTGLIEKQLPLGSRVIRVMPNIAAITQSAACVFTRGHYAGDTDAEMVREMLNHVGLVEEVPEEHMDAVTGVSGNGPAYGFITIQALADGGVKMGLNRNQATRLAAQSLLGAAKMILQNSRHPEQLKDEVCSPGGTSIHALTALEQAGYRYALIKAVEAGTLRSQELRKAADDSLKEDSTNDDTIYNN